MTLPTIYGVDGWLDSLRRCLEKEREMDLVQEKVPKVVLLVKAPEAYIRTRPSYIRIPIV